MTEPQKRRKRDDWLLEKTGKGLASLSSFIDWLRARKFEVSEQDAETATDLLHEVISRLVLVQTAEVNKEEMLRQGWVSSILAEGYDGFLEYNKILYSTDDPPPPEFHSKLKTVLQQIDTLENLLIEEHENKTLVRTEVLNFAKLITRSRSTKIAPVAESLEKLVDAHAVNQTISWEEFLSQVERTITHLRKTIKDMESEPKPHPLFRIQKDS